MDFLNDIIYKTKNPIACLLAGMIVYKRIIKLKKLIESCSMKPIELSYTEEEKLRDIIK